MSRYVPVFAKRDMRAPARDKQNARLDRLTRESRNLDPKRAAQHAKRQIRAARNALEKVI